MAENFDEKKYQVYLGTESYIIALDAKGKLYYVQVEKQRPIYRENILANVLNKQTLDYALKFLLVAEPASFIELYMTIYENDTEMFKRFKKIVNSVGTFCVLLSTVGENE